MFRRIFMLLAIVSLSLAAVADKPRWVNKGTNELQDDRSNDSYTFVCFHTWDGDLAKLRAQRMQPVTDSIATLYGIDKRDIVVAPQTLPDGRKAQRLIWTDPNTQQETGVTALLIDDYEEFADYEENMYGFELYQLYAISEPGETPAFDTYELTTKYKGAAMPMSLVPGLGQLYKGQTTKGWVIISGEALLVSSAIYCDHRRSVYSQNSRDEVDNNVLSWRSKARSWRTMRNISISLAAGLYVYNLIDAAVSPGARQVKVHKATQPSVAVLPSITDDGTGPALSFVVQF